MRRTRVAPTSAVAILILAFLLTGCPKRPAVTETPAPPPAAAPAVRDFVVNTELEVIHFDFDSDRIRPPDAAILDKHVAWLKGHPDELLLIAGHADDQGTSDYNAALGERRARTAKNYLVSHGVEADRITASSLGELRPVCTEQTDECRAKNRRVTFLTKKR